MSSYKSLIASLSYKSFYPNITTEAILFAILKTGVSESVKEIICLKDDELKNFLLDTRAQLSYNRTFIFKATAELKPYLIVQFILPTHDRFNDSYADIDYIMIDPRNGNMTLNLNYDNIDLFRDKETFLGLPLNYLKEIHEQNKLELDWFTQIQDRSGQFFDLVVNDPNSDALDVFFMTDEDWIIVHGQPNLKLFIQGLLNHLTKRSSLLLANDATILHSGRHFTVSFIKEMAAKYIPENMKLFDKLVEDFKTNNERIKSIDNGNGALITKFFNDCNTELFKGESNG